MNPLHLIEQADKQFSEKFTFEVLKNGDPYYDCDRRIVGHDGEGGASFIHASDITSHLHQLLLSISNARIEKIEGGASVTELLKDEKELADYLVNGLK